MSHLVEKMTAISSALSDAGLPYAFGGAMALAYCIDEPRGTRDLDVNVFVKPSAARAALSALPSEVEVDAEAVALAEQDGQTRLWWDGTPIDIFFNSLPLHEVVAERVAWVPLDGRKIPVVDCASLIVFKALVDRGKDWVDIESIAEASSTSIAVAAEALAQMVPDDDPRVAQLYALDGMQRTTEVPSIKKALEARSAS
jgi:hypothetical protein